MNAPGVIGGKVKSTNDAANGRKVLPTVFGIVAAAVGGLWVWPKINTLYGFMNRFGLEGKWSLCDILRFDNGWDRLFKL